MLKVNKSRAASATCFERDPHAARFGPRDKRKGREIRDLLNCYKRKWDSASSTQPPIKLDRFDHVVNRCRISDPQTTLAFEIAAIR
jgi:hypothetical protein